MCDRVNHADREQNVSQTDRDPMSHLEALSSRARVDLMDFIKTSSRVPAHRDADEAAYLREVLVLSRKRGRASPRD